MRYTIQLNLLLALVMVLSMISTNTFATSGTRFRLSVISTSLQCADSIDNDGDGFIDYSADIGCASYWDDDETNPIICGDTICNGAETCSICSPDCGSCPVSSGSGSSGGGGGGGGGSRSPVNQEVGTTIIFSGISFPGGVVSLLKDGTKSGSITANAEGVFELSLTGLKNGSYTFTLYANDPVGNTTSLYNLPVTITQSSVLLAENIFLSPLLNTFFDSPHNILRFTGYALPMSEVSLTISNLSNSYIGTADQSGFYSIEVETTDLSKETYSAYTQARKGNVFTPPSKTVSFNLKNGVPQTDILKELDINGDGKLNLIDVSILAFWYKKKGFPPRIDYNKDGSVDLKDFSILLYYWTG